MKINIDTDYSSIKKNTLIFGDSLKMLYKIKNSSVDHCITDPPYNISGYDYKKEIGWIKSNKLWEQTKKFIKLDEGWDKFENNHYDNFTELWVNELFRIVKPNGNIIIFGSSHNIFKIAHILEKKNKKVLSFITWFKRNAFPNITNRMLCSSCEYILWSVNNSQEKAKNWTFNYKAIKEINVLKKCKKCKKTLSGNFVCCPYCSNNNLDTINLQMRDMWDIPSTPPNEKVFGKHPTQKPIDVITRLIVGATNENDIVIDPFTGSGTIPLVALKHKRRFIAIDNNKNYCNLALKRLQAEEMSTLNI